MDTAGLLNTMKIEDLVETCRRLNRSCNHMSALLVEFEEEKILLTREQERLHAKIERVTTKIAAKDKSSVWALLHDLDKELKISSIFKAKQDKKAAKRRRLLAESKVVTSNTPVQRPQDDEDMGPFSDNEVQQSWGGGVRMRPTPKGCDIEHLQAWLQGSLCHESVAEAEAPESAEIWTAQVAAHAVLAAEMEGSLTARNAAIANGHNNVDGDDKDGFVDGLVGLIPERLLPESMSSAAFGSLAGDATVGVPQGERTLRKSMTEGAAGVLGLLADWAGASPSDQTRGGGLVTELVTVVLSRASKDQVWGLGWQAANFNKDLVRIVDKLIDQSVAAKWNQLQEQVGHPERCIRSLDRLMSVNGKTNPDEMRVELQGLEVVLEFHRFMPPGTSSSGLSPSPHTPVTPGQSCTPMAQKFVSRVSTMPERRARFSESLRGYLKAVDMEPCQAMPSSPSRSPALRPSEIVIPDFSLVEEARDQPGEAEQVVASGKAPHSVIAQVMSLQAGSVRVSWVFDWEAVEGELAAAVAAAVASSPEAPPPKRCFEILQRHEASVEGHSPEEVRRISLRPLVSVALKLGQRYSFQVRAVLLRSPSDGSAADDARLWESSPSPFIVADLRQGGACVSATSASSLPSVSALVASELGGGPLCSESLESVGIVTFTSPPHSMSGAIRSRGGGVASKLGDFLAGYQRSTCSTSNAESSTPMATVHSPEVLSAAGGGVSEADQVVPSSRASISDPLVSAVPRVVAVGPLDPAAEKRDIAQRLRIRHGGQTISREEETLEQKLRSLGMESDDDGDLMRLSTALSSLERTAVTREASRSLLEHAEATESSSASTSRGLAADLPGDAGSG